MAGYGQKRLPPFQRRALAVIALGIPLSAWGARYPGNTWLQVGPVAAGLVVAVAALRRWPLSNLAAGLLAAFVCLHLLAAHYTYTFVPYDDWARAALGRGLNETFGWSRNMFDRLVHFLFGVLIVPAASEWVVRHAGASRRLGAVFAVLFVLGLSAVYEVFEWGLTITLAPEHAGAYNGEQGDRFDSQRDMALAGLGALLALPLAARRCARFRDRAELQERR